MELPATVDLTVKVTTPEAFELPDAAEIVSLPPRLEERVTVLPDTGFKLLSFNVTVIVEVVLPSAVIEVGDALTVERVAETPPAVKVTEAV